MQRGLLKRHLGKAAQLAAVQLVDAFGAQQFNGPHPDAKMLINPFAVKMVGHARQLDLAVQWLVADAQQSAIGHPKAETVGGDRGTFHVQRHGATLAEALLRSVGRQQLPVAVMGEGLSGVTRRFEGQKSRLVPNERTTVLLTRRIPVLSFVPADADNFCVLRAVVRDRSGDTMSRLIAAHAPIFALTLITNNEAGFKGCLRLVAENRTPKF